MDMRAGQDARRWLAEAGVTQVGDDAWIDGDAPEKQLTANEVAQSWAGQAFTDERLDAAGRLGLAFGLLDLLDDYWVTCEIRFADRGPSGPLPPDVLWDGYRRRLEAPETADAVTYSLWVDWFEDRDTCATAFAEVLGRDADHLRTDSPQPLLRRARRVLECSGPVPWAVKERAYGIAARLPALHPALFKGLLGSYRDVYGDLEPAAALGLLTGLNLPADTAHSAELRAVLTAGHRNHHHSPHAWEEVRR
ncbi:hypothetical protein [Streptomyces sp. NBC_00019]|uniref:hypothetical protein n=1 Tax=Streptomyces sp. NBC_00019 TaxID=2975623 RepID=UPI00324D73A5